MQASLFRLVWRTLGRRRRAPAPRGAQRIACHGRVCAATAVLVALSGCGSIVSWSEGTFINGGVLDPRPDLVLAGVRTDIAVIGARGDPNYFCGMNDPPTTLRVLAAVDVPLSLALDLAALPLTVPLWLASTRDLRALRRFDEHQLRNVIAHADDAELRNAARAELKRRGLQGQQ